MFTVLKQKPDLLNFTLHLMLKFWMTLLLGLIQALMEIYSRKDQQPSHTCPWFNLGSKPQTILWGSVILMSDTSLMLAGLMPSLMLVAGDALISDVKHKLINVPSIIVCDSAQKMMLNYVGVKTIIINVGTNDISVSLLPPMKQLEPCSLYDQLRIGSFTSEPSHKHSP